MDPYNNSDAEDCPESQKPVDGPGKNQRLRKVSRLTDIYARHRTAGPFLIFSTLVLAMGLSIRLVIYLSKPYIKGHDGAILVMILAIMVVVFLVTIFFLVDRWGGRLLKRWGEKLFDHDGRVSERPLNSLIPRWLFILTSVLFGICIVGGIALGVKYNLPDKYMQPISAIYVLPFMVVLGLWRRTPVTSPLMGLWPLLYAIHAVLVVVDAPVFRSIDGGTHMCIATWGYGALIGFLAYIHSKLTLRKLKKISRLNSTDESAHSV